MASSFDAWALLDEYHLVVDCIVVTILVAALHRNYVHRIVTIAGGCCALAHVSPAPAPRRAEIVLDPADERRRDRHETPRRRHKRRDDATKRPPQRDKRGKRRRRLCVNLVAPAQVPAWGYAVLAAVAHAQPAWLSKVHKKQPETGAIFVGGPRP